MPRFLSLHHNRHHLRLEISPNPPSMAHMRSNRLSTLLLIAVLLTPFSAYADGIDLPLLTGVGIGVAVPLLTFNVLVEGLILARFIHVSFRGLWRPMLWANVLSLLAGIPVTILNAVLAETLLPAELVARMGTYPMAICIGILNYYLATVLVEFLVLRRKIGKEEFPALTKPLAKGLLVGHVVSYAVLGPLFFMYATPKQTVQTFVNDSRWAAQPATRVVFITPAGQLQTVLTDGSQSRTILTNEVRDFVATSNLDTILIRGASNEYFLAQNGALKLVTTEPIKAYGDGMDFSPGGRFVGWFTKDSTLRLWDSPTGIVRTLPQKLQDDTAYFINLTWSTNENIFYILADKQTFKVTIETNANELQSVPATGIGNIIVTPQLEPPTDLANHYGRIGSDHHRGDDNDWETSLGMFGRFDTRDTNYGLLNITGLSPFIRAHSGGNHLTIADNPGVFHLGRRPFIQAVFAPNLNEIVFDDAHHIYLADIAAQKVGRITTGKRFILLSPLFSKSEHFMELFR
jgi:hypothetical protein